MIFSLLLTIDVFPTNLFWEVIFSIELLVKNVDWNILTIVYTLYSTSFVLIVGSSIALHTTLALCSCSWIAGEVLRQIVGMETEELSHWVRTVLIQSGWNGFLIHAICFSADWWYGWNYLILSYHCCWSGLIWTQAWYEGWGKGSLEGGFGLYQLLWCSWIQFWV